MAKINSRSYRLPWYFKELDKIIFLIIFGAFFLIIPGQNIYTVNFGPIAPVTKTSVLAVPTPGSYPEHINSIWPGDDITAGGIVIYDIGSGAYLYKRNENNLLAPASTTKLMTALVALDTFSPDDVLTVHSLPGDGQMMGLVIGEKMTLENLLYGMLIYSGNDAAYVIAENFPGGMEAFISAMNHKAISLHLTRSSFTNPIGYDDPNHKMTPIDLARLAAAALGNKIIAKMVAIPSITISDVTHTHFHQLKNVNELLGKIPGVGGIKTGWTEEAGENLVTLVERNNHRVIFVVLKSQDRFGETARLIDWVFGNFEWKDYSPK
jgi:serine-type D-Ala-D-Ala carboxypeptidase (penicillin-binding protein 5/6)